MEQLPKYFSKFKEHYYNKMAQYKKDKLKRNKKSKEAKKRAVDNLSDRYVKALLRRGGLYISPRLVEMKREQILLHRELKTLKKGVKNGLN